MRNQSVLARSQKLLENTARLRALISETVFYIKSNASQRAVELHIRHSLDVSSAPDRSPT